MFLKTLHEPYELVKIMFVFAINLNMLYVHVELGWLRMLVIYVFSDYFFLFHCIFIFFC